MLKSKLLQSKLFLVGLALNLLLLLPLFSNSFFSHHLDHQIIRLQQLDKCIKDLQIPCRWTPDLGSLYGQPLFNYLPPFPYYLGELFYLLTGNLLIAYKSIFIIGFVASYIFMYLLGRRLWGDWGGAISAIFYSYAPYHGVSLYVRGDIGELWILALFPAIIWSVLRLWQSTRVINILTLGLCFSIMVLSDLMLAVVSAPFILVLVTILNICQGGKRLLRFNLLAFLVGISLAAFYIIPAIVELNLVHDPTVSWPHLAYTEHFKGFSKILVDRSWGYGESIREMPGGAKDTMSYQIGIVHLLVIVIAVLSSKQIFKRSKVSFFIIVTLVALGSISTFMIHPKSAFIWAEINFLKYFQYPWRFLSLVIFFYSLAAGSIMLLVQGKLAKYLFLGLVSLVVILNFSYFNPDNKINISENEILQGSLWKDLIRKSSYEYLPRYSTTPPNQLVFDRYQVIGGHPQIDDFSQGSNWLRFKVKTEDLATIQLSQRYFPNWTAYIDGQPKEINPNNTLGLMIIAIDPGEHIVEVRLLDTPIRIFANLISVAGFILFLFLVLTQFSKTRRFLLHYIRAFN